MTMMTTLRRSLGLRFYTCHSMSSTRPNWRDSLEECADTIESSVNGKPDFAIALVGDYSGEIDSATLEDVSSLLASRGWPASVGVRTKSIQRNIFLLQFWRFSSATNDASIPTKRRWKTSVLPYNQWLWIGCRSNLGRNCRKLSAVRWNHFDTRMSTGLYETEKN